MATLTMDVDDEEEMPSVSSNKLEKKRFEVKKVSLNIQYDSPRFILYYYIFSSHFLIEFNFLILFQWNAVALWAWGMFRKSTEMIVTTSKDYVLITILTTTFSFLTTRR